MTLSICPVDPRRDDVRELIEQADAYLLSLYPPELCFLDGVEALSQPHVALFGAFRDETLLGMGAAKLFRKGEGYGEIKRVFVRPEARGMGAGRQLMLALEDYLRDQGMPAARLETGTRQAEALALYTSLGYRQRGPFGDYADNPMSIFLEKPLTHVPAC